MKTQLTEDFAIIEVRIFNQVNTYGDRKPAQPLKKAIEFHQLMIAACEVTGISQEEFQSKDRKRFRVYARTLVSIYLQGYTSFSLQKIGQLTGGRDHSSTLHDKKKYSNHIGGKNKEWFKLEERFVQVLNQAYGRQYFTEMPDITKL